MTSQTIKIQITKARQGSWYQNKLLACYDVIDTGHKTLYYLSPEQLKKMKKAKHLQIGIVKEDCEITTDDLSYLDIDNFLKLIKE